MKKVFLDTNIALDFLLRRDGVAESALAVFEMCHRNHYEMILSSLSFSNMAYILRKQYYGEELYWRLGTMREMVTISDLTKDMVDAAIKLQAKDFEDALQYFSAISANASCIVTRNIKDFPFASIPVLLPTDFLVTDNL